MKDRRYPLAAVSHFIHRYFLWLLIGSYVLAGLLPAWGLGIGKVTFAHATVFGETTRISLPMVMLAFLLLTAGLGVETGRTSGTSSVGMAISVMPVASRAASMSANSSSSVWFS